jgi:hypothetical protein
MGNDHSDDRDHRDHGDQGWAGPYWNPVERFGQLPEVTRQWLENLRADDINDLNDAMKFYHATKAGGKFIKWLVIVVVACFVGAAAFGEAIQKLWSWLFHAGHS